LWWLLVGVVVVVRLGFQAQQLLTVHQEVLHLLALMLAQRAEAVVLALIIVRVLEVMVEPEVLAQQ
jgi:hypothetical protein